MAGYYFYESIPDRRRSLQQLLQQPPEEAFQTLNDTQCAYHTTVDGDDAGTVAAQYGVPTGVILFGGSNRVVLDAAGWRMGDPLPTGLNLTVCNSLCNASAMCASATDFCFPVPSLEAPSALASQDNLGLCEPGAQWTCRSVAKTNGAQLLTQPCTSAPPVQGAALLRNGTVIAVDRGAGALLSSCPGVGEPCWARVKTADRLEGYVHLGLPQSPSNVCGTEWLQCCGSGEACLPLAA